MTRYEPVAPVGEQADLEADTRRWVSSEPVRDLITAFGGDAQTILGRSDLETALTALDQFSDRWDTRRGKERNLADQLDLNATQEMLVAEASTALGLTTSEPPRTRSFDHVFLLGGLMRACLARPAYAARLIDTGVVEAAAVTALGGHRQFNGNEFELAAEAGHPELDNEFDALELGTRNAFRLGEPTAVDEGGHGNARWTIHTYEATGLPTVRVAAAPSSDPENRRADTADTYGWFAETIAALTPGSRVLAVTTTIYVPAQQAAAVRMLTVPYGVHVETVGMSAGDVMPELSQTFTASNYLQEVRSTIRNLRSLIQTLRSVR